MATQPVTTARIELRPLQTEDDRTAFRTLNEEWIERYFTLEDKDREILEHPEKNILGKGGRVFIASMDGKAVGCVALVAAGNGTYELAKMAVSPELRGQGIGRRIIAYAVAQAKAMGAAAVFLSTNAQLKNAIHLYESTGFHRVSREQLPPMPYERANVFMKLDF